jgi:acetyltransferase-like isoleucine patch superfamily enzyme
MPLEPTTVPEAPRVPEPPAYVPPATPPGAPPPSGLRARLRARRAGARGALLGRGVVIEVAKGARFEIEPGAAIGDRSRIVVRAGTVRIGAGAVLGERCRLIAHELIAIGAGAMLGDEVIAIDFDHRYEDVERPVRLQGVATAPVVVGAGARIGTRTAIQRGVTIGDDAEVGALAVVTRDVPAGARVGGVPAVSRSAPGPGTPGGSRSLRAR